MVTIFHKFFLHGGKNQIYELDIFTMIKKSANSTANSLKYYMIRDE